MSYINPPRLHFSGRFFTDPSTVNNIPSNFEGPKNENNPGNWNWNPYGHHDFYFIGCTVTKVVYSDGSSCEDPEGDSIIGRTICSNLTPKDKKPSKAKIADIDVNLQYLPSIFGLNIGLQEGEYDTLFNGQFKYVALDDFWFREPSSGADNLGQDPTSVFYQSVLENVSWADDVGESRFLNELKASSAGKDLSTKFMLDGYVNKFEKGNPDFKTGQIVGTIGIHEEEEPQHFLSQRFLRFKVDPNVLNTPFARLFHSTGLYFAPFSLDTGKKLLRLDLGNSLPRTQLGKAQKNMGHIWLAVRKPDGSLEELQGLDYLDGKYLINAHIFDIALSEDHCKLIAENPLCLVQNYTGKKGGGIPQVYLEEDGQGRFARADSFIFRLNPGDVQPVKIRATQFGQPAAGVKLKLEFDWRKIENTGLNIDNLLIGSPEKTLQFPAEVTTDEDGWAKFNMTVNPEGPGAPRFDGAIDGQLYTLTYTWEGVEFPDPHHHLTVRVFDKYDIPDKPTWDDAYPIFNYYAELFPAMKNLIDLSNEQDVTDHAGGIKYMLSADINDSHYMPVTRDLSGDKRKLLLKYLDALPKPAPKPKD